MFIGKKRKEEKKTFDEYQAKGSVWADMRGFYFPFLAKYSLMCLRCLKVWSHFPSVCFVSSLNSFVSPDWNWTIYCCDSYLYICVCVYQNSGMHPICLSFLLFCFFLKWTKNFKQNIFFNDITKMCYTCYKNTFAIFIMIK